MSTPYLDTEVPLPHAALLSYFRNPAVPPNTLILQEQYHPPRYNDCTEAHQSLVTGDRNFSTEEEEELATGFWGERVSFQETEPKSLGVYHFLNGKRKRTNWYAFLGFWCAVSIYIMGAFGIFFVIYHGFSQYGMGTGMAKWMIHGHARRSNLKHEMRFCLATPNREAPSPQRWPHLQPKTYEDCTTEIVTVFVSPAELWKINPDAEIVMGEVLQPNNRDDEY